jgi:FkbH-like protein
VLEYSLRIDDIPAKCVSGEYNNILQDSQRDLQSNAVVIFWEMANLIDGLQYKANVLNKDEIETLIARFKSEIEFVIKNLTDNPLVIFNKFSAIVFNQHYINKNNFDIICDSLNEHLAKSAPENMVIIDIDKVIARLSISIAVDFRNYYASKNLYSVEFFKEYVSFITPIIKSINGKTKKALILDCDNTLWNGIIGEDGMDGVTMSALTQKGVFYEEAQYIALELAIKGIFIALNSKNNPEDVNKLLIEHPDIILKDERIAVKMINWQEKYLNLKSIAEQLNISFDSLVFVDDSDFEIDLIKKFIPQVTTIQVPKDRYLYPEEIRKKMGLFYSKSETKEDLSRIKMFKQGIERETSRLSFQNIDEYLFSLGMHLTIYIDDKRLARRIAQLTQKTNQFNFTTRRYTEADILNFIDLEGYSVFAIALKDRFGDFGVTGVAILKVENQEATFDTFLMSCRILGRKIEIQFIDEIIRYFAGKDIKLIRSIYINTQKNSQVANFFDEIGFTLDNQSALAKNYSVVLENYQYHSNAFIETKILTYAK